MIWMITILYIYTHRYSLTMQCFHRWSKPNRMKSEEGRKRVIHVYSFILRETILNHCQYIIKSSAINTQGAQQVHVWQGYNLWSKPCFGLSQHSLRLKLRRTEGTLTKLDMLPPKKWALWFIKYILSHLIIKTLWSRKGKWLHWA